MDSSSKPSSTSTTAPTTPIMDLTTLTQHPNLPGGPRPSLPVLPTEIINLIFGQLLLDAKGPEEGRSCQPHATSDGRPKRSQKAKRKATHSLAALAQTCRRLNKIVTPFLYQEPFLLQANLPHHGKSGLALYDLVKVLAKEGKGFADMVRVYEAPKTIADNLRAFTHRCDIETYPGAMTKQEAESYWTMLPMFNKYTPFLSKLVANEDLLDEQDLMADLVPAVIICLCRNIKHLKHLTIGDKGSGLGRFLWRDVVAKSVTFPKLEVARLEGIVYTTDREQLAAPGLLHLFAPLTEAAFFVDRAPNLRHLTLESFSSDPRSTITLFPQRHLSSLKLHQCAFLNKADLVSIIRACPRLERFVFTSEASPTVRRVTPLGFDFVGPAVVLEALAPVSQHLKELSIEYAPLVDVLFEDEPDDTGTDDDLDGFEDEPNDTGTNGAMNAADNNLNGYENLIKSLGRVGFPNLKNLRICHSALWWTPSDGRNTNELVELVKGCSRLESLDVTRVNIRDDRIRPQLEELGKAMGSVDGMPLLKGIRVAIDWPSYNPRSLLSDLLEEEHLATYRKRGIKLLVDLDSLWCGTAVLNDFSAVHKSVREAITIHPILQADSPS